MAKKDRHVSETPATAWLKAHGVAYTEHPYDYVDHGGTAESARQLGVPEHEVIKTLVMQDERAEPLIVLMHGDRQVSLKKLAREIGAKSVEPCRPEVAERHSGYQVGGTSPFGLRKPMRVFVEASVLELPRICINGGRRGFLVGLAPAVLTGPLAATPVRCALPGIGISNAPARPDDQAATHQDGISADICGSKIVAAVPIRTASPLPPGLVWP